MKYIYLCGLGAIGSSYAGLLQKAYPDGFKVIADKQRIEKYKKDGIFINEKPFKFDYLTPDSKAPMADILLIAVKYHQLHQAIEEVRPFVGENTVILTLQNGISSEEVVGREFGMEKMLYSFVVDTDATRNGDRVCLSKTGTLVFGGISTENIKLSERISDIKKVLERASIPCRVPENMLHDQWWKFMMNVGLNQTSALMRAPYGAYKNKEAQDVMRMACREVIKLSDKLQIGLCENDIDAYLELLRNLSPDGKTSMLQDVEAGRKTEVEIFAGTVMQLGKKYGVETPVNTMLFNLIKTLEQSYL